MDFCLQFFAVIPFPLTYFRCFGVNIFVHVLSRVEIFIFLIGTIYPEIVGYCYTFVEEEDLTLLSQESLVRCIS